MKHLLYMLLFSCAFNTKAQYNLVTNYSFENIPYCPNTSGYIYIAQNWTSPGPIYSGGIASTCNLTYLKVPFDLLGQYYQQPVTGNNFACFYGYYGVNYPNSRSYLQNQLKSPLKPNKCYYISCYMNFKQAFNYGIKNLSMSLTYAANTTTAAGVVLNLPEHVYKFGRPAINDTLPWVKIEGIYTASGGERYVTIGNFKDDAHTDTVRTGYNDPNGFDAALYFCDDVFVIPIDSIVGGLHASAGANKTIVAGDSVFIGQEITNLNCNWHVLGGAQIATNTPGIFVKPTTPTSYVVEQNLCGNLTYDTVVVNITTTTLVNYQALQNSISIYPNPNDGNFTIQNLNTNYTTYYLSVVNVLGKTVLSNTINFTNGLSTINLKQAAGIYFVTLYNQQTKQSVTKKISVE
jgi:Secretion system C-terminal sorting domain